MWLPDLIIYIVIYFSRSISNDVMPKLLAISIYFLSHLSIHISMKDMMCCKNVEGSVIKYYLQTERLLGEGEIRCSCGFGIFPRIKNTRICFIYIIFRMQRTKAMGQDHRLQVRLQKLFQRKRIIH